MGEERRTRRRAIHAHTPRVGCLTERDSSPERRPYQPLDTVAGPVVPLGTHGGNGKQASMGNILL